MTSNYLPMLVLFLFLAFLCVLPILLIFSGVRRMRAGRSSRGRIILGLGISLVIGYLSLVGATLFYAGPGRSGIVTQGTSPAGLEYCIVQSWQDLVEPYKVSFYVRNPSDVWRWHYLDHEDLAWRAAAVQFEGSTARIYRNGKHFKDVSLPVGPEGDVERATFNDLPSTFTVADIAQYHRDH